MTSQRTLFLEAKKIEKRKASANAKTLGLRQGNLFIGGKFATACAFVLCISTSERVLRTPFAGRNPLSQGFLLFFWQKKKKIDVKQQKTVKKGGILAFKCYS